MIEVPLDEKSVNKPKVLLQQAIHQQLSEYIF